MFSLKLTVFDSPQIELDGKRLTFKTRKALALLVYLAVSQQPHSHSNIPNFLTEVL
jgi:DNA-binding SARP family transcriptional activator